MPEAVRPHFVLSSAGLHFPVSTDDILIPDSRQFRVEVIAPGPQSFESPFLVPLVDVKDGIIPAVGRIAAMDDDLFCAHVISLLASSGNLSDSSHIDAGVRMG